jgi:hypothetical protein
MYLGFCYNAKPPYDEYHFIYEKTNKQKNIENAVIYCIHIPLSQLSTLTAQFKREKWFNIGGNRSIVTRYRLDSQFHCSYLDSRGVPGKTREIITLLFPVHDFRWRHFRWCNFRWCNFRSRLRKRSLPVTSRSPSIPHKCEVDGASILLTYMYI